MSLIEKLEARRDADVDPYNPVDVDDPDLVRAALIMAKALERIAAQPHPFQESGIAAQALTAAEAALGGE